MPLCTGEAVGRGWSECYNRIVRKTSGGQVLCPCVQVRQGGGQLLQRDCEEDCWGTGAMPLCTGEAGGWSKCYNRIVRKTAGGQTLHPCVQVRQGGGQSATTTGL